MVPVQSSGSNSMACVAILRANDQPRRLPTSTVICFFLLADVFCVGAAWVVAAWAGVSCAGAVWVGAVWVLSVAGLFMRNILSLCVVGLLTISKLT